MTTARLHFGALRSFSVLLAANISAFAATPVIGNTGAEHPAIPFAELGAKATSDYQGEALTVTATGEGARLRCGFQKLEGRVTAEGLWLESTAPGEGSGLRLVASAVGRGDGLASSPWLLRFDWPLELKGKVELTDRQVRFIRPGLTEEYSVSVDGLRQDFVITERPMGDGDLRVELSVSGAKVQMVGTPRCGVRSAQRDDPTLGVRLVLDGSSRSLAYSRLRATDAAGKELKARMEIVAATRQSAAVLEEEDGGGLPTGRYASLAVVVDDTDAFYPVRIDPTFSDDDWISMGGLPGADGSVYAAVVDSSGNLYIGGRFTVVGNLIANRIAKWNGINWSALGAGVSGTVGALAVSGSDLYAGGYFITAGGNTVNRIAKWNGSSWSALGSGMNYSVSALAVSGSDLYAGGNFVGNHIAKWNGSSWSPLGSGVSFFVNALAVSGNDLYAGGSFPPAGPDVATRVAKWNGSTWSPLGSEMNNGVYALAVSGSNLYVGGAFTMAGGSPANLVAKWDGSCWSPLGSGVDASVVALAASGSNLYVGGNFTMAGGKVSTYIAQANIGGGVSIPPGGVVQNIRVNVTFVTLDCLGIPTTAYALQRASDVRFTESLTTVLTTNAPASGQFQCIDPDPPSTTAFYRLLKQQV